MVQSPPPSIQSSPKVRGPNKKSNSSVRPDKSPSPDVVAQLPNAVLSWKLVILLEIVLSGFQLELYGADERVLAYWYAERLLGVHVGVLEGLVSVIPEGEETDLSRAVGVLTYLLFATGSQPHKEAKYQQQFLTALQHMCKAMFAVRFSSFQTFSRFIELIHVTSQSTVHTLPLLDPDRRDQLLANIDRMRLNFLRRYKWAFRPENDDLEVNPVGHPDFGDFVDDCAGIAKVRYSPWPLVTVSNNALAHLDQDTYSPSKSCKTAHRIFKRLIKAPGGCTPAFAPSRIRVGSLSSVSIPTY
jgi:N-alpha-acetyltransferase 35, NatC auxiliary subunit